MLLTERTQPKTVSLISVLGLLVFLPLMLLAVQNIAILITRASGTKANIVVDTANPLETIDTGFFHAFSQGGEEAKDMVAPVVSDIRALRPRVIRLDHLYDNYGVTVTADGSVTGWGNLDNAVSTILATGAKPILALSYMPSAIAQGGVIINPPNDWAAWEKVVQQTIQHFSGDRRISGIYYEVWNEPDLPNFGSWKTSGEKNYITLYRHAAIGASRAQGVSQYFFGGPATANLYQSWILALVRSGARIDFLSWHTYQQDPKYYDRDQRNLTTWLLPYPSFTLTPTLITEFGFTGDKSTLYGTDYAAAHAAAVIRQLITGGPEYLISFQPIDGPNQQSGNGWGLITHTDNGLRKKPRYYVYNFLDAMAGNRLTVSGEGTWVTGFASTRDNVIRLMLVNFDRNGKNVENVPVKFSGLNPGTYSLKTSYLFGANGYPPGPTSTVNHSVTAFEGSLSVKVPLTAQKIVILELTPQTP